MEYAPQTGSRLSGRVRMRVRVRVRVRVRALDALTSHRLK